MEIESANSEFGKSVNSLKRKINNYAKEIKAIYDQGLLAVKDKSNSDLFFGMCRALEKYHSKFESTWEETVDLYVDEGKENDFPKAGELSFWTTVRTMYYESNKFYECLKRNESRALRRSLDPNLSDISLNESRVSKTLPRIPIPTFDGDILKFPKFRDTFNSLFHTDQSLLPVDKFHYLVSALEGPAASVIGQYSLDGDNYEIAWKTILETFDNKRMLASAYLSQIMNFKPLQGKPSVDSLKSFLTSVSDSVSAFKLLKITNAADFILFFMSIKCLDPVTREQFEIEHKNTTFPSVDILTSFVRERSLAMQLAGDSGSTFSKKSDKELSTASGNNQKKNANKSSYSKSKTALLSNDSSSNSKKQNGHSHGANRQPTVCPACNDGTHSVRFCEKFEQASVDKRLAMLKNWKGCKNCLNSSHITNDCPSKWHCRFCSYKHHSSLHKFESNQKSGNNSLTQASNSPSGAALSSTSTQDNQVILGTILAEVLDANGSFQPVRMVLDSGSQFSFMTTKCMNRLGLAIAKCAQKISGIGQTPFERAKGRTSCVVRPRNRCSPNFTVDTVVVSSITSFLPSAAIPADIRLKYESYPLADPSFWKPGPVDVLLGVDCFADVFTGTTVSLDEHQPKLLGTVFGHVVVGRLSTQATGSALFSAVSLFSFSEPDDLNESLNRFWEIEETNSSPKPTDPEDVKCENHFSSTHSRLTDGRYMVRLPFKYDHPSIGDSSNVALNRFQNLERKLSKNPEVKSKYHEFMSEYIELGHMSLASSPSSFVIPHHCVVKNTPNGTKLRVVFDASVKVNPSNLNEQLLSGEKLQNDIRTILMNFRRHKVVFVTDIVKMYRMILLHPDDRKYQHIHWRFSTTEAVQRYELNTVTYGLASAPFLALRVLKQLCIDEGEHFPLAASVISDDIYVDDVATGADTIEEACALAKQIIGLLGRGGFALSKWATNRPELFQRIPASVSQEPIQISSIDGDQVKILGLKWDPDVDAYGYEIELPTVIKHTKRAILSVVAKIFDPLGFLSPVVVIMKSFIQELWKAGYTWDQEISTILKERWETTIAELPMLSSISIPRFVNTQGNFEFQLVGFADASSKSYCGTLYLRVLDRTGTQTFLLTSKTKLTPTKVLTIPRLELCGALLLARLYESSRSFASHLKGNEIPAVLFSDSSVVLSWINTPTFRLKTFVSNRVSEIISITKTLPWRHVSTHDNPSDLGTRGQLPSLLIKNDFWWLGPKWLCDDEMEWPESIIGVCHDLPELKNDDPQVLVSTKRENPLLAWMARFSSFEKMIRSVAWLKRWMYNSKHVGCCCCLMKTGSLSLSEIISARIMCIRVVQQHYFFTESDDVNVALKKFSVLSPVLDHDGIVRVGGRLRHANIAMNQKYPILLPANSHFSTLLVDHLHRLYLHPGPTALQALIQANYWIPSLRKLIRKRGFYCIVCYKSRASSVIPKMGDLPAYRVNGGRPFVHVGVDFAGPFMMRDSLRRKSPTSKVYLCLFVCMTTKALHLEAVTRLTTEAFLAAFERFTSRRGLPSDMYSDCGSNFIGAASHLQELASWFKLQVTRNTINDYAIRHDLEWHFNPPLTPHMGGIWEAGVKSVKRHLHLITGGTPLTYEELSTVFAKIEAMLNSRPLCPLSDSPEETDFLSPGHFLVGGPLLTVPEPSLLEINENRLNRWQLVKKMTEQFWARWTKEYLSTLQHRYKWKKETPNVQVGDIVLLKDENTLPMQWPLARVDEIYPGKDGVVRVVTVSTAKASFKRSVHKLIPLLPLNSSPYELES